MAILITGGAGYIGSHTMVELLEAGRELVVVDNFVNSKPESLERVKKITGKDDVIGVDNSQEMLGIALDKKFESGLNIQYLCQDMRDIDMFGTIGITICALDSINHLSCIDDVRKVFEKVSLFSEYNGLFIFDVNTLYKHRKILADNTFTYETDNVYCIWENSLNKDTDEVKMNLEFFELEENGLYSRSSDSFSEKAYSEEDIEKLLAENHFEIVAKYGDDTFEYPSETSQRIIYTARCKLMKEGF